MEEGPLPDHLRCNRNDGRKWRCSRRVLDNLKQCELHHIQGRHRQHRKKVPDSLKLKRRKRLLEDSSNLEIRSRKIEKTAKPKAAVIAVSEALDEALKKMKLKKGDLRLELIRMVLMREVEKRKNRSELEELVEGDLTRNLPNGFMEISPAASPQDSNNAASSCDVKIGADSASVTRRCFRSKNIEPLPIGTLQVVPNGRNVMRLRRGRTKRCHWCQRSAKDLVKCQRCQKESYCKDCIKERYYDTWEEVKMACPVCSGTCRCKTCIAIQSRDSECKDSLEDENEVYKILRFHYLICMLLPVLKQINQDHCIELAIEAKREAMCTKDWAQDLAYLEVREHQRFDLVRLKIDLSRNGSRPPLCISFCVSGKDPSELQILQTEFGCDKQNCNNCKTSILDFHRSCPNCSYVLCLSCSRSLCRESLPGGIRVHTSKFFNERKACICGDKQASEDEPMRTSKQYFGDTSMTASASLPNWNVSDGNGGMHCPPTEFGGCGDSLLELRRVYPSNWTKKIEISAEEIACSYDFPETSDMSSSCSLCLEINNQIHGIEQLQEVATRENSHNNFVYYPTILEIHSDNLEHFQKHWSKGHPVIVRNVLQSASELIWDPIVMFCVYLERSSARSENDSEVLKATNCLDWCEVEIGTKQLFMGSLREQIRTNTWCEMLKVKSWLSSSLFQEYFPAHYSEIIHALPLQEYMNPKSGLLNLVAKLPEEVPKPDLGPCVYISYGSTEELVQTDFVAKLCYNTYDSVNILAHTTDAPISREQLKKLRKLMKQRRARDQCRPTKAANDQKTKNKVNRKSSLHDELQMKEAGVQNMAGKEMQSRKDSIHEARASSFNGGNRPYVADQDQDSDTESDSETSEGPECARDRVRSSDSCSCGAQWDVFRRQDVPKLTEYLSRHSDEFPNINGCQKHVVHPIFDESYFLDRTHKIKLKEEYNIEPWTFEQNVGEAVIIPAGCPYQRRNLKSCVNVVLDFVSPESVTECIDLVGEISMLPETHKAKIDKLEVKKMVLHSIGAAIKEIHEITCMRKFVRT